MILEHSTVDADASIFLVTASHLQWDWKCFHSDIVDRRDESFMARRMVCRSGRRSCPRGALWNLGGGQRASRRE